MRVILWERHTVAFLTKMFNLSIINSNNNNKKTKNIYLKSIINSNNNNKKTKNIYLKSDTYILYRRRRG